MAGLMGERVALVGDAGVLGRNAGHVRQSITMPSR